MRPALPIFFWLPHSVSSSCLSEKALWLLIREAALKSCMMAGVHISVAKISFNTTICHEIYIK